MHSHQEKSSKYFINYLNASSVSFLCSVALIPKQVGFKRAYKNNDPFSGFKQPNLP